MVVQRTLDKIEELKERPHHERRIIALYAAVGVSGFLLLFWGFFAVRNIGEFAISLTQHTTAPASTENIAAANTAQTASAAAATEREAHIESYTASSTNGYVDLVPKRNSGL